MVIGGAAAALAAATLTTAGSATADSDFVPTVRDLTLSPGYSCCYQGYNAITALSPLTEHGTGDLVARDTSGVLWYYRGTGNGSILDPRAKVGGGWGVYNTISGAQDLTGDGRADIIARDTSGVLWLYRGTGNAAAPYAARVKVGTGWNIYNILF